MVFGGITKVNSNFTVILHIHISYNGLINNVPDKNKTKPKPSTSQ